jgi:acyl-CoA thioesterase
VTRESPGRFAGDIGEEWNCPVVPQGGMVVATAARAMAAELDDASQSLRSLTVVFAGSVQAGPVEVEVDVLRHGRTMSQARATLRNPGAHAGTSALAVFGAPREGFTFTALEPPTVPDIDDCPRFSDPPPPGVEFEPWDPWPFWTHFEGAPAIGHAPWEKWEPGSAVVANWNRFLDPPRLDDGQWDPLAVVALCDTMPGAVGEWLGSRNGEWYGPSADFTVHVLDEMRSEWILGVNRVQHAGDGYASVSMEMWDMHIAQPTLVAYATQVMFFTTLKE